MAFFGAIPGDRGNRGESTMTELPMRSKQRRKHHEKDQTMANRMTVCFIFFTKVGPRYGRGNFTTGIGFRILVVKFQWPNRGCYFVKTITHRHPIRRGLILWCFHHFLFFNGNSVTVESGPFPQSSRIAPKMALKKTIETSLGS